MHGICEKQSSTKVYDEVNPAVTRSRADTRSTRLLGSSVDSIYQLSSDDERAVIVNQTGDLLKYPTSGAFTILLFV